ncbi:lysophospholipase [Novosphingobium fluoreni]|uniref:Lysophospholipase n=1 Tax=Novosphingobium fluoreni TaxID=1391222 RepID=A0A7W6BY51_9SPHN|nr:lysophospholipase [Novosphingobium fluoreni]
MSDPDVLTRAAAAYDGRSIPPGAQETTWRAADGQLIRRLDWPQPGKARGALLFAPGRADFYEKHLSVLYEWHAAGWHVSSIDWRGQAMSGRLGLDATTGHADDFAPWVADLAAFWRSWEADAPGPHVLVGHSMGGHLALRAVVERQVRPDALVLVAPMLGLNPGWVPSTVLHPLGNLVARLRQRHQPAWKWERGLVPLSNMRMQLLTHDDVRFADEDWWYEQRPDLALGPPSWGWIAAALASIRGLDRRGALESVDVPVLLLGTTADRLVSWRAIRRAAARIPKAELVTFGSEARHEILRESATVRQRALDAVARFLDRAVPPQNHSQAQAQAGD